MKRQHGIAELLMRAGLVLIIQAGSLQLVLNNLGAIGGPSCTSGYLKGAYGPGSILACA